MEEVRFVRQEGIVSSAGLERVRVTLIGAGGIGSTTATFLTKMGVKDLEVFDFDKVEDHNLASQMFPLDSVGKYKVDALRDHCLAMSGTEIRTANRRLSESDELGEIVISAVDSMASRKEIWNLVMRSPGTRLYIDGRMGGWVYHRLVVNMLDGEACNNYKQTLHSDEEGEDVPCSQRAIIFNTGAVGASICEAVAKYVGQKPTPAHIAHDLLNSMIIRM